MPNKFLLIFTLFLWTCNSWAQKSAENLTSDRKAVVELIICFKGDITLNEIKEIKIKMHNSGIDYLGFCLDQKSMLVSTVLQDENTRKWAIDEVTKMSLGAVLGTKDYAFDQYFLQCGFLDPMDAAYFKNKYGQ